MWVWGQGGGGNHKTVRILFLMGEQLSILDVKIQNLKCPMTQKFFDCKIFFNYVYMLHACTEGMCI